jgi:hypothetical protein
MALISISINRSAESVPRRRKRAVVALAAVAVVGIGAGTAAAVADSTAPSAYVATTPTFLYNHAFTPSLAQNVAVSNGGVPSGATAVQISLTASGGTANGSAFVYATGASKPGTANVTWQSGKTTTTQLTVPIGTGGDIRFVNGPSGNVTLKAIVVGYYTAAPLPTAFEAYGTTGTTIGTTVVSLATLSLPVGNFLVSAETTVSNATDSADNVGCYLYLDGSFVDAGYAQPDLNGQADGQAVISTQGVVTSANSTVDLQCIDTTGNAYSYYPTITAVEVGSISSPALMHARTHAHPAGASATH